MRCRLILPIISVALLFIAGSSVEVIPAIVFQFLAVAVALFDVHRGGLFKTLTPPSLLETWPLPRDTGSRFAIGVIFLLLSCILLTEIFAVRTWADANRLPRRLSMEKRFQDKGIIYTSTGIRLKTDDGLYVQLSCPHPRPAGKFSDANYCMRNISDKIGRKADIVRGPLRSGASFAKHAIVYEIVVDGKQVVDQTLIRKRASDWLNEEKSSGWQIILLSPLIFMLLSAFLPNRSVLSSILRGKARSDPNSM